MGICHHQKITKLFGLMIKMTDKQIQGLEYKIFQQRQQGYGITASIENVIDYDKINDPEIINHLLKELADKNILKQKHYYDICNNYNLMPRSDMIALLKIPHLNVLNRKKKIKLSLTKKRVKKLFKNYLRKEELTDSVIEEAKKLSNNDLLNKQYYNAL